MGTVYRAQQLALGRDVAVKLFPAAGADQALIARFQREARTAASLEHPHSLPIYAAGESEGLLYLVMRLVDGPDLQALIADRGPLPAGEAVSLVEQVAGALDAAHAAGLVHRDVKPGNVLLEPAADCGYHAYLSDFGLMRRVVESGTAITRVGEWVGTADYVAPEQMSGRRVDGRADVYALAGVLYTMLSGRAPFVRDSPAAVAWAHVNADPPTLPGPGWPQRMNAVIARGMAKRPEDRYRSAGELAVAARVALSGTGRRRSRRRVRALLPAALVLVAAAVVVIVVALGHGSPSSSRILSGAFSLSPPAGWHLVETEAPRGPFLRTELFSADGSRELIIDRTPGESLTPAAKALSVEQATARTTPGYRRLAFYPQVVGGRRAFVWEFTQPGSARIDVFEHIGSSGFAVLGSAANLSQVAAVTLAVAESIHAR
jgi:serine/threonine-protein kinase